MLMLGDNIFKANLQDVVNRQQEDRADAAFLVEEVPWDEDLRYGVCNTNKYGESRRSSKKPEQPPSNLVVKPALQGREIRACAKFVRRIPQPTIIHNIHNR